MLSVSGNRNPACADWKALRSRQSFVSGFCPAGKGSGGVSDCTGRGGRGPKSSKEA